MQRNKPKIASFIARIRERVLAVWRYFTEGVWEDTRRTWKVNITKTISLSIKCFLDGELQSRACALAFRTILAIVPVLALLFAIGRGFGLQDILEKELIIHFPAQSEALTTAFGFVDSYLAQTSGGLFVGIGVIFLLWTLISLLSGVETAFNHIWQVPKGRSLWRKLSDYTTIFIILPLLMILSNGVTLLMTTSLKMLVAPSMLQPTISILLDFVGLVLTWLFFTGTYIMIPNVKVKFRNAFIAGVLVGTGYQVLQWLFVSGQIYVAKYNAIYGSFSFLPLFLIWIQLVWLITLIGAVVCYSLQNINEFNFGNRIKNMSASYRRQVSIAVMTIIAQRFAERKPPLSLSDISQKYSIPINILAPVTTKLASAGLVNYVIPLKHKSDTIMVQPAVDVSNLKVGEVLNLLNNCGDSAFIPGFSDRYGAITRLYKEIADTINRDKGDTRIIDIQLNHINH